MDLRAYIRGRYSVEVIDADSEKALAGREFEASSITEEEYRKRMARIGGFLPFSESPPPDVGGNDSSRPYYEMEDGAVVQKWEIVNNDINVINQKIKELKAKLSDTDYKVMKCYEATLLNLPMPYAPEEVRRTRQEYRDGINTLEALLNE